MMLNDAIAQEAIRLYGCNCVSCYRMAENELSWKGERLVMVNSKRLWHLMRRDDGSICLYWTDDGNPAHNVVWDSLDKEE